MSEQNAPRDKERDNDNATNIAVPIKMIVSQSAIKLSFKSVSIKQTGAKVCSENLVWKFKIAVFLMATASNRSLLSQMFGGPWLARNKEQILVTLIL